MTAWAAKYKDSRWQQKRLEILNRDGRECRSCGAAGDGVTLNVHHAYYESGNDPWDYPDDALVTLCADCHKEIHSCMKRIAVLIKDRVAIARTVTGYAYGMKNTSCIEAELPSPVEMYREGFGSGYGDRMRMLRLGIANSPERRGE
jgi:hypothetical protein